ncbi:Uma2 family endonuclease [Hydrogenimonas sp.]
MPAIAYDERYTVADFNRWEGDWELIGGHPYAMSPFALPDHQWVSGQLLKSLMEALEGCETCYALMETEVAFDEETVVRPDVMVVCDVDLHSRIEKTPKLVFEVVSRQSAGRDERLKFDLYEKEGVTYYGLVYPDRKKCRLFGLEGGRYVKVGDFFEEFHTFRIDGCEATVDFKEIWLR